MDVTLPELLNCPPKLLPVITKFKDYNYFLIEGGRSSGKTVFASRLCLYLADKGIRKNIICGRDAAVRLDESSHKVVKEAVEEFKLPFTVQESVIKHKINNSVISFRGFNQIAGQSNARAIAGVDLIWLDEAQQIGAVTMKDLQNTLVRFPKCKVIITMNRYMRDDPAFQLYYGRPDTLHIQINYNENPFNGSRVFEEAEACRLLSEREYNHDWLGQPLEAADDYLFSYDKLHAAFDIEPFGEVYGRQRVVAVDLAAQGNDRCVAVVMDRESNQHWRVSERISWDGDNTNHVLGKIIEIVGRTRPTIATVDCGGMGGQQIHSLLTDMGLDFKRFDGASTQGIDAVHFANARAEGYHLLKDWVDEGRICLHRKDAEIVKQLEKIRFKYAQSGKRLIQPKLDMKKELGYSPDDADALMMAVWASVKYLGKSAPLLQSQSGQVKRINRRR
jgi:hypothetical protein